jgi:Fe-S oxidoreductase
MWADFDSEVERIANVRIRQAPELGVDTIVTACPWCLINMIDAIKSVNAEDKIDVKDLGQ